MQGCDRFLQALSHLNRNRKRCQLFKKDEQHDVTERPECEGWNHDVAAAQMVNINTYPRRNMIESPKKLKDVK